jgi:DNA invertase Pin-like site-specific DNA recombinase
MPVSDTAPIYRCAIYTRKSTEEGLDRELNSLEAQRDTCSAYIRSQRHKGWVELPQHYDDGGWSGANLARPALQQLLTDIEAGRIDVVVIYKIDRLSRSLLDFVRLLDTLERYGVAFVSITQAFDTSDSMGRLILNVLLTFAQFERELLSDRLRDKFAALRRRGKFIGGKTPFGYDKVDKRLVVYEPEAAIVRDIYERYPLASSGNQLLQALRAEGIRNKVRECRNGKFVGGKLINPGILHKILTNPLYLGKVAYRGEWFEGEHDAIVTREQWDRVQAHRAERHAHQLPRRPSGALLMGLLYDTHGRRMHPDLAVRAGKTYRYYATEATREGKRQRLKVVRTNADEVERLALAAFRSFLCDRPAVSDAIAVLGSYDATTTRLLKAGPGVAKRLGTLEPSVLRTVWQTVLRRAELDRERLRLYVSCFELGRLLDWDGTGLFRPASQIPATNLDRVHLIDAPCAIVREHRRVVLPVTIARCDTESASDPALVQLISEAREAQTALYGNRARSLAELAKEKGKGPAYYSRLIRLNYLAPDIAAAIIDGDQPHALTRGALLSAALPLDWAQQRQMFGFPPLPDHGYSPGATTRNHAPRADEAAFL